MIQLIRGFKDILPGEVELWQKIEQEARTLFESFGFREIRIPIMEKTELFKRSIGEDTDIVEKEMYTFADRGGDMVTLRPEATASIVRAYIQHKLYAPDPVQRLYVIGPMFRRERPQKGRMRQFHQIGAEALGRGRPGRAAVDVYESEPVTGGDHPLLRLPNALCTPHLGYNVRELYETLYSHAIENILAFASGNPANLLNPDALSARR